VAHKLVLNRNYLSIKCSTMVIGSKKNMLCGASAHFEASLTCAFPNKCFQWFKISPYPSGNYRIEILETSVYLELCVLPLDALWRQVPSAVV
jgi:hypothetical protein